MSTATAVNQAYTGRELRWLAGGVMTGDVLDRTGRATHYLTRTLYDSPACPKWAKGVPIKQVGPHVFLRA